MHGHDHGADGGGGQQQGHDFKRQHVAAHQRVADIVDGDRGSGVSLGSARALCITAQPSSGEDGRGDRESGEPVRLKRCLRARGAARQQDGKDHQDGNRADINEDLREAGELRVQREEQQRQSQERHRHRQRAVNQILEKHRCQAAGQGERGKDAKHHAHRHASAAGFPRSLARSVPLCLVFIQHSDNSWARFACAASTPGR